MDSGTPEKLPFKPFNGNEAGTGFTKDNQPDPSLKSAGWQRRRSERLLTQKILENILGKDEGSDVDNLTSYVMDLVKNARAGNPKAIETVNKAIEDDIIKINLEIPTAIRIIRDTDV